MGLVYLGAKPLPPVPPSARDPLIRAYLALSTPNVSDALDRLGIQGAPLGILPLWPGTPKLVGRALTMQLVPLEQGSASPVLGPWRQSWLANLETCW